MLTAATAAASAHTDTGRARVIEVTQGYLRILFPWLNWEAINSGKLEKEQEEAYLKAWEDYWGPLDDPRIQETLKKLENARR